MDAQTKLLVAIAQGIVASLPSGKPHTRFKLEEAIADAVFPPECKPALEPIPKEVHEAAITLQTFFERRGFRVWEFKGVRSR